jgi:glycosyltransferase involved in cell wall biosynthesis
MNTLWIASWYPTRLSPFDGDFVKRHAQAVSLYDHVDVIYVARDTEGTITHGRLKEKSGKGNFTETIVYYYLRRNRFSFVDKLVSAFKYYNYYQKAVKEHIATRGKPQLVHLHVSTKAGLLARWIKKKYDVDYVLTEHWTGFLPEAEDGLRRLPFIIRRQCMNAIRAATALSTVSEYLSTQLKKTVGNRAITIIPNVVDTSIFFPVPTMKSQTMRFLHVSTLGYQKNPEDILRSFAIVKQSFTNFRLDIFGTPNKALIEMCSLLELTNHILFHEEVPQEVLAEYMNKSHALILYSRYETFGCVVIEANACGIPAIVSDIPVMHEILTPCFNGLIVEGQNPIALANVLIAFMEKHRPFKQNEVAEFTERNYGFESVGLKFHKWYELIKQNR